jgi:F-type H+-transporting ATPase subunit b
MTRLSGQVPEEASGGLATLVQQTAERFGVNWPDLIAQTVSFLLVALILRQLAYKPLMKVLDERRRRIDESMRDAERVREELARAETQRREVVDAARAEADRIVTEARAAAAVSAEREAQRAEATAAGIVAAARAEALQERSRVRAELRGELGALVVQATAAVTGNVLSGADRERLRQEAMRELA